MGWFERILSIVDKVLPSRKGALVDQINGLTAAYQKALEEGRDTDAATYRAQLKELRRKAKFTNGDV